MKRYTDRFVRWRYSVLVIILFAHFCMFAGVIIFWAMGCLRANM